MITFEKEDLFELYWLGEEDPETGGTVFQLEYGTALDINHLLLKKLIKEWGYEILSEQDYEIDPLDTYHHWDTVLMVFTTFPYSKYEEEREKRREAIKSKAV